MADVYFCLGSVCHLIFEMKLFHDVERRILKKWICADGATDITDRAETNIFVSKHYSLICQNLLPITVNKLNKRVFNHNLAHNRKQHWWLNG